MLNNSRMDTAPGSGLAHAFDDPASKRRYVRRMFATIADRYDLITVLLSFGRDRHWKARVLTLAGIGAADRVLDLACGTGDLTFGAAQRGAWVVGLDITPRMLVLAARKASAGPAGPRWVAGDMGALPVGDGAFDAVTTGYGLRNVPELDRAIAEIARVLRPGGRFCSLDFDRPEARWLRVVYLGYLNTVGGALGWLLHRDPDMYRYIPASIRRYPGARAVAARLEAHGFVEVRHVRVLGGLMAIHVGIKTA